MSSQQDDIDARHTVDDIDADADAIFAELEAEEDSDISNLRQQRIQEQADHDVSTTTSRSAVGTKVVAYETLTSDDATLQFTTEHEKACVHFFHPDFARCGVMDEHLRRVATCRAEFGSDDGDVKFARVDVAHAAFVVERLAIRILPCVIGFVKGAIKGRIVGFEGICWDGKETDGKVAEAIEETFVEWGIVKKRLLHKQGDESEDSEQEQNAKSTGRGGTRAITGRKQLVTDEDDDWD